MSKLTNVIIGGGAAGFFGAIACAAADPDNQVILLEKARQILAKVRISGGGRCNVTHACFDPSALVQYYPRGNKALRGPFTRFQPKDTIQWFEERGVILKTENDGRMFPITDSSETIINCLVKEAQKYHVDLRTENGVQSIKSTKPGFSIHLTNGSEIQCDHILMATGSTSKAFSWLQELGHKIEPLVPSLFTFNIPDCPLEELAGISVAKVRTHIQGTDLEQVGPILITHWGFSGPAILKLSAWGARILHDMDYKADLRINWLPDLSLSDLQQKLLATKLESAAKLVTTESPFEFPRNLWKKFVQMAGISPEQRWAMISKLEMQRLIEILNNSSFHMEGKSTYKDEFVTCGGVNLSEVNFKTMESRLCPGLYFAGEVLDIDGVTGGFNFQNAWTTSWIAGNAMAQQ